MKNTNEVAIFWDYENCPASTNTSGYAIVNNIRSVAQSFGSVKIFKAYLEITEQVPVSRAAGLRSELQSSGVSLTDCPHNGRKDVADKMIIVDMLAHAMDNPAPSTIVLISGDRDFAYALSILRLRSYRVVLITLPNVHQSLRAQASLCFDWNSDVLEPVDPTFSNQPTSPRRGKTWIQPVHDKFYSDPKNHNPSGSPFEESSDEMSANNVELMNDFQDETKRSRTIPEHDAKLEHDSLPPDLEQSKRQPIASSVASDSGESPAGVVHSPVASSCHTDFNGSIGAPLTTTACGSSSSSTINTSTLNTPKLVTFGNVVVSTRSSAHSTLRESSANSPNLAQHSAVGLMKPMSIESTMQMLRAELELRQSSLLSQLEGSHPPINAKAPSVADNDPSSPPANVTATPSFLNSVRAANCRRPTSVPTVPDKFKILVQCLKSHRSRGIPQPLRSKISSEITHDGAAYRQAGVLGFGEYVAMAEKAGIVEVGGAESISTAWISLRGPWYNARVP